MNKCQIMCRDQITMALNVAIIVLLLVTINLSFINMPRNIMFQSQAIIRVFV